MEAAGLALAVIPLIYGTVHAAQEVIRSTATEFVRNCRAYGVFRAIVLHTSLQQARHVIHRVNRHIVDAPTDQGAEASSLKSSYVASFNMIAVASAIVAQIAITALSLPNLEGTHWTCEAAFVTSLVTGCLSVYYPCINQLNLGGLHDSQEVLEWLTSPRILRWQYSIDDTGVLQQIEVRPYIGKTASFNAALMLVAPAHLLNWSLLSFLVGVGIYFGLTYTKHLGALAGENANLAVLLVYIIVTTLALANFIFPMSLKTLESTRSVRLRLEQQLLRIQDQNVQG